MTWTSNRQRANTKKGTIQILVTYIFGLNNMYYIVQTHTFDNYIIYMVPLYFSSLLFSCIFLILVKFPVKIPVKSNFGKIHSKVSSTGILFSQCPIYDLVNCWPLLFCRCYYNAQRMPFADRRSQILKIFSFLSMLPCRLDI